MDIQGRIQKMEENVASSVGEFTRQAAEVMGKQLVIPFTNPDRTVHGAFCAHSAASLGVTGTPFYRPQPLVRQSPCRLLVP